MFALPKAALPLFRSVAGACVLPTAKRLLTLMVGAILATGRRTITNLLCAVGGLAPGHPSSYHRVFAAPLVVVALGPRPGRSHPAHLVPEGSVTLAGELGGTGVMSLPSERVPPATTPSTSIAAPTSTARGATATLSARPTATPPIAGATSGSSWRSWSASRSPTVPGPSPCWSRCIEAGSGISSIGDGTGPPLSCSAVWWPCSCTGSRTAISR